MPARTPGNPQNRPELGAPGPPDIFGLSSEIIGFRNRGWGPVGRPQGVQVKTLILNIKCLPKGHHPEGSRSGLLAKWFFGGLGYQGQKTTLVQKHTVFVGLAAEGGKAKKPVFF